MCDNGDSCVEPGYCDAVFGTETDTCKGDKICCRIR